MTKFLSVVKLLALARRLRDRALRPVIQTLGEHDRRITALEEVAAPRVTVTGPAVSGSSEPITARPGGRKNL